MKQLYLKSIILAIFSLISITASAYDCEVGGIYYNLNKTAKTASVTFNNNGYNSYSGEVTIPSTITNNDTTYRVTNIGYNAFDGCIDLFSVEIPNSVTSIGESAFRSCSKLTSIIIPSNVTSIGEFAFFNSGLTSITIPNSVTDIRLGTFSHCSRLTSIVIPSSVTNIGIQAFEGCTGLTSIEIPSSVTSIEGHAFGYCTSLTSVVIPSSVTSIGWYAFYNCTGLTSVTIPNSVTSIEGGAFSYCSSLASVIIPNSVTVIEDCVFNCCDSLNSITIPNSVTSIGNQAFECCIGLKSIEIPSSVTTIGNEAFAYCSGLTSIVIPSSVTSIGDYAFYECSNLTSVKSTITDVFETGERAFNLCGDATLYVPKGLVDTYKSTADWNSISNIVEMSNNQYDVNNDGSVDISDVVALVNAILSSSTTDSSYDVNGDGNVDISDVVSLVNTILNGTGTGSDDNSQAYLTCPDENHPHMIDLGLPSGTKWACCNVGASSPEEYGGYYAWGETEEKNDYSAYTYKYFTVSPSSYQYLGTCICGTKYDVAQMKWGDIWRMPTLEEQVELVNNCSWTRINYKGVEGCLATGLNGNRIFLPLAGFYAGSENEYIGNACRYWSGTLDLYTPYGDNNLNHCFSAYDILITNGPYDGANDRTNGEQIRPVAP